MTGGATAPAARPHFPIRRTTSIFHGALTLGQFFSARPMLSYADYRGPLAGLYHCTSGAHPGGGVTGAPRHNGARVILQDLRWGRMRRRMGA